MPRQHGVHQLRDDGVVVADDAGKQRLLAAQPLGEVVADFVAHGTAAHVSARDGGFQLSEGVDARRGRHMAIMTRPAASAVQVPRPQPLATGLQVCRSPCEYNARACARLRVAPSPGVCAPRRRAAGPREHHGGARQRPGARRRRPRDRRPAVGRRRARRHSRQDARPHDRPRRSGPRLHAPTSWRASTRAIASSATAAHPFRGQGHGVPTLAAVLARHRDTRVIIEMKGGEPELARAVARDVRGAGAVDRVCVGSFHQTLDRDAARGSARDRDQRLAAGSALGAASIVGALAVDWPAPVRRVPGARARRPACAWSRRRSSTRCTPRGR